MRAIKVTYRAVFAQPFNKLNPSAFRIKGEFPVEVFGNGGKWQARELASTQRMVYKQLGSFSSAENGRLVIENSFERRLEPWQTWGCPPTGPKETDPAKFTERLLLPDEIQTMSDGKVYWKEADDYTHILHAPDHTNMKGGMPPAACGQKVHANAFINNKANKEPTCKKCAEVWREHYQEKKSA